MSTQPPLRLLFVCVENANRSQMAEAFARIHGGANVEAFSAGSRPSGKVNPKAIAAMKELGYDLGKHGSKSLQDLPDVPFDFVATMGCGDACPAVRARHRDDWNIPDPKNMSPGEFNAVRDLIQRKVVDALTMLQKEKQPTPGTVVTPPRQRLTLAGGGWVLLAMGLMSLLLIAWAVAPAMLRHAHRPPGDGEHVESYGFDLTRLDVARDLIVPAMLHRDMVPVMTSATATGPDDSVDESKRWKKMQWANDLQYGKYLVSSDLVIGVEVNGESRAYPIGVMYVHEIINDSLGNPPVPIAVTYHWPCDSVVVFDRRIGEHTAEFHNSGLVYNSNMLMFDAKEVAPPPTASKDASASLPKESLWSQLLGKGISGKASGHSLAMYNAQVQRWDEWSASHPKTTVLNRDLSMAARYKDAVPTEYLQSEKILFPVRPMPTDRRVAPKATVLAVEAGALRRVYPIPALIDRAKQTRSQTGTGQPQWTDILGDQSLTFIFDTKMQTVRVESERPLKVTRAFWFAWHAIYPADLTLPD